MLAYVGKSYSWWIIFIEIFNEFLTLVRLWATGYAEYVGCSGHHSWEITKYYLGKLQELYFDRIFGACLWEMIATIS